MTKTDTRSRLREAMEQAGSGWIFRYWGKELDKNLDKLAADLGEFVREYSRRFEENPDPLELQRANPSKGAAFFQVDTLMVSLEMKIMIWRILLGCEIAKVEFKYEAGKQGLLSIALRSPYGGDEEVYTSQQPSDFRVLRHFGATGVSGNLCLQGYYAARGI